jgi:glutamine synthetase
MKDLRERLQAQGVHTLVAQFTDLHGVAKGKFVPLAHLDDLLTDGVGFSGASIAGTGLPRTGARAEYFARGSASTVQAMPWMPGYARVVCDGFVAGQAFEACPRQVLRRAVASLADRGWSLRTGIEPEFFLLKQVGGQWLPADDADRLDKPSYDLKSLPRRREFLRMLQTSLAACGLDVTELDHKGARGKYSVNFGFADALTSADNVTLFRLASHALAEERGIVFSQMPKPFSDQPGCGMHMQVTLWRGRSNDEKNLFAPHRRDGSLDTDHDQSEIGRQFIAGVLHHAPALCALAAPTVNSYKGLMTSESPSGTGPEPVFAVYGPNNRTALIRTLHSRFEWRLPDSSSNPYLTTAALIAAGLDGVDRKLDPGPECADDLFALPLAEVAARGARMLPRKLDTALDALETDEVITAALGPVLAREYLQLKRAEWTEYARHVHGWEFERYATAF